MTDEIVGHITKMMNESSMMLLHGIQFNDVLVCITSDMGSSCASCPLDTHQNSCYNYRKQYLEEHQELTL